MNEPGDDELRARFERLREDDHAHAPSFRAMWARAEPRARTTRRALTAALIGMVAAASVVLAVMNSSPSPSVAVAPTISDWSSPTAGLLHTMGSELLAPPPILSSVLGGAAIVPAQP